MTNVVSFYGAMHPRHYVRSRRLGLPLTEAELDAQITSNRARYEAACEAEALGFVRSTRSKPSLIPLDNTLRARLTRWVRGLLLNLRPKL